MARERDDESGLGGMQATLAERLADWPLLRLLLLNRPFRWVVILFLLAIVGVALLLPKIWRVTPDTFRPEVRISLLDRIQAWSLKRKARATEAQGLPEEAVQAWRAAWANNLADTDALRGLIGAISLTENPEDFANLALQGASWLLRLDNTNRVDLEPVALAWIRSGAGERVLGLLEPLPPPLSASLQRLRLIALFEAGQVGQFAAMVNRDPAVREQVQAALGRSLQTVPDGSEREFALVSLAYLTGSSPNPGERVRALELLREARNDRRTERRALNLEFLAYLSQRDAEACRRLLAEMREIGRDTIRHHTSLWRLLLAEGRNREAAELLARANLVPNSAWDAYQLARVQTLMGRLDEAKELLRGYSQNVGWFGESLILMSEILMRQAGIIVDTANPLLPAENTRSEKNPLNELRSLGIDILMRPDTRESLGAYGHFLQGVAEWAHGNRGAPVTQAGQGATPGAASEYFDLAVRERFSSWSLAMRVASILVQLGGTSAWAEPILLSFQDEAFRQADSLIDSNEPLLGRSDEVQRVVQYLNLLIRCAAQRGQHVQGNYLLQAAERLHRLMPGDAMASHYYAAALLIFRLRPEQAIAITLRLHQANPDQRGLAVNHAAALLQNGRAQEAEDLLRSLFFTPDEVRAGNPDLTQYNLIRFEANWHLGNFTAARIYLDRIRQAQLYPAQKEWLEAALPRFHTDADRPG